MSQPTPSPLATPIQARPSRRRRSGAPAALAALSLLTLAATTSLLPLTSRSETNTVAATTLSASPESSSPVSESNAALAAPQGTAGAAATNPASPDSAASKTEAEGTKASDPSSSAAGRPESRADRDSRRSNRRPSSSSDRRGDDRSSRRGDRSSESGSDTNAPASSHGTDFASFKIIADRNIFNPNRGRANARTDREPTRKPTQIDHFSLVGTMSYAKGDFAFFDGSSSSYRKTLKCGDAIAGYTVKAISANAVQLASGETPLDMTIGSQLRREDEGEWKFIARSESSGSSSSSLSGSSTSSSGDRSAPAGDSAGAANDILLKLMQKREQEK